MKKIAVLMLALAPMFCAAAGKSASATMQVSFTVTEACTVQTAGKTPKVECAFETPFQVQSKEPAVPTAVTGTATQDRDQVVVYF